MNKTIKYISKLDNLFIPDEISVYGEIMPDVTRKNMESIIEHIRLMTEKINDIVIYINKEYPHE